MHSDTVTNKQVIHQKVNVCDKRRRGDCVNANVDAKINSVPIP